MKVNGEVKFDILVYCCDKETVGDGLGTVMVELVKMETG